MSKTKNIEANKFIRKQVENIKKKRMSAEKVVSLRDFREMKTMADMKTILVVDDDEVMRNALKRILEAEKYRVLLAADGIELSKVLESSNLDMILLDVNLPWVDGIELCRIMREHNSLCEVPIIMVSARKERSDIEDGIAAGADEYVTKPFDVDYIVQTIEKNFKKSS